MIQRLQDHDVQSSQNAAATSAGRNFNRRFIFMEILIVLGVIAVWIVLQAWLLPKLGVST